jgi:acetyltransferase-like isoleucine patch superfamily enzyme
MMERRISKVIKLKEVFHFEMFLYIKWIYKNFKWFLDKDIEIKYKSQILNSKLGKFNLLSRHCLLANSTLGDYSYLGEKTEIRNADIGKFCSIGHNVHIGLGAHPTDMVSTHPVFYSMKEQISFTFSKQQKFDENKRVKIGHDVWIGANVTILDGVEIKTGAIIGANALVSKNVEPYSIVGGVPAKIIKYRFDHETINLLLQSKWWDNSYEWFQENAKNMTNINKFIKKQN